MPSHGRTKIELFKDGKPVFVHEEGNLVTNAVTDLLARRIGPVSSVSTLNIPQKVLYSGIALWNKTLDEYADKYTVPAINRNTLIGYGTDSNSVSSDTRQGVFNTNLSSYANGKVTLVWDFDEEHGNGSIACATLVPAFLPPQMVHRSTMTADEASTNASLLFGGSVQVSNGGEPFIQYDDMRQPIAISADGTKLYVASITNHTLVISYYLLNTIRPLVGSVGEYKYYVNANHLRKALRPKSMCYEYSLGVYNVPQNGDSTCQLAFTTHDGYFYVCECSSGIAANTSVNMLKINLANGTSTSYTLSNHCSWSWYTYKTILADTNAVHTINTRACAIDGKLCVVANDTASNNTKVVLVDLENNSNYIIAHNDDNEPLIPTYYTNSSYPKGIANGQALGTNFNGSTEQEKVEAFGLKTTLIPISKDELYIKLNQFNTIYGTQRTGGVVVNKNGDILRVCQAPGMPSYSSSYAYMLSLPSIMIPIIGTPTTAILLSAGKVGPESSDTLSVSNSIEVINHIAKLLTINNLESPVVKTADLTMRITYVLEEQAPTSAVTDEEGISTQAEGDE